MTVDGDDLEAGQEFPFSSHTVSQAEIVSFARHWDPLVFHTDPEAEQTYHVGELMASGIHTLASYQRLIVEALWSRAVGAGGRRLEVRFCRPCDPARRSRSVAPDARVAYVDFEPVAVAYSQGLLVDVDGVSMTRADVRDAESVLTATTVLDVVDFAEPVAVLAVAIAHAVADEDGPDGLLGT